MPIDAHSATPDAGKGLAESSFRDCRAAETT
jgi:hypothetical protein